MWGIFEFGRDIVRLAKTEEEAWQWLCDQYNQKQELIYRVSVDHFKEFASWAVSVKYIPMV